MERICACNSCARHLRPKPCPWDALLWQAVHSTRNAWQGHSVHPSDLATTCRRILRPNAGCRVLGCAVHLRRIVWQHPRLRENVLCLATGYRRSEEHTSELQSRQYLVCRLLLEKKEPPRRHPVRDRGTAHQRTPTPSIQD